MLSSLEPGGKGVEVWDGGLYDEVRRLAKSVDSEVVGEEGYGRGEGVLLWLFSKISLSFHLFCSA